MGGRGFKLPRAWLPGALGPQLPAQRRGWASLPWHMCLLQPGPALFILFPGLDSCFPSKKCGASLWPCLFAFQSWRPVPCPQLPSTWVGHVLVVAVTALGSPAPGAVTVGPRGLETTNDSLLMGSLPPACQPRLPFYCAQAGNHARPGNLSLPVGV